MTTSWILVKTVNDCHIVMPSSGAARQIVVKLRAAQPALFMTVRHEIAEARRERIGRSSSQQ